MPNLVLPVSPGPPPVVIWGATIRGNPYTPNPGDWPGAAPTPSAYDSFVSGLGGPRPGTATMGGSFLTSAGVKGSFSTTQANRIRNAGAYPYINWAPMKSTDTVSSATYNNAMFADDATMDANWLDPADHTKGTLGAYIDDYATAVATWNHPCFIRFAWEMNKLAPGQQAFPYNDGYNGNATGSFITMWQAVHTRFAAIAPNATWIFTVDYVGQLSLATVYPGDAYVDWIGIDVYQKGTSTGSWQTFEQGFDPVGVPLQALTATKPVSVEIGCVSNLSVGHGNDKADWYTHTLSVIPTAYPRVGECHIFNDAAYPTANSVALEDQDNTGGGTSPKTAFGAGVQSNRWVGNQFGAAPAGKITRP